MAEILYLQSNTNDGDTQFVDVITSKILVGSGNVKHSTAQAKFGSSSIYFDGSGDYITVQDPLNLGAGDFTIQLWYNALDTIIERSIIGGEYSGSGMQWGLRFATYSGYNGLTFAYGVYGSYTVGTYVNNYWGTVGQWDHIAVVRKNGVISIYINGISRALSVYNQNNTFNPATDFTNATVTSRRIGGTLAGAADAYGYFDDILITDTALYSSDFTPPGELPTNSSGDANYTDVVLLVNAEDNYLRILDKSNSSHTLTSIGGSYTKSASVANTTASSIRSGSSLEGFFSASYGIFNSINPGENLTTDFGTPTVITQVKYSNYGSSWAPTSVLIQSSSDNVNWNTELTYADDGTQNIQTLTITTGVAARYWRIYQNSITRGGTPSYEWHLGNFSMTNNTLQTSTQVKYGASSIGFNGSTDYILSETSADFILGSGDWTIEAWVRPSAIGGLQGLINIGALTSSGNSGVGIYFNGTTLGFLIHGSSAAVTTANYSNDIWYHIALVRSAGGNTLFVNSIPSATNTATPSWPAAPAVGIGRLYNDNLNYKFNGYIDDVRITKGVARYPTPITPPTDFYFVYNASDYTFIPLGLKVHLNVNSDQVNSTQIFESEQGQFIDHNSVLTSGDNLYLDGIDTLKIYLLSTELLGNIYYPILQTNTNFTYEMYAKPTASHNIYPEQTTGIQGWTNQRWLIGATWTSSPSIPWGIGVSVATNGIQVFGHGASWVPCLLSYSATISDYVHIVVVVENNTPRLYVNNVLVRTGLNPARTVYMCGHNIGGAASGWGNFAGNLRQIRYYNRILSTEEIEQNYFSSISAGEGTAISAITGTVQRGGSNFANATVRLYHRETGELIASKQTDANGDYIFRTFNENDLYYVTVHERKTQPAYQSKIRDFLSPKKLN